MDSISGLTTTNLNTINIRCKQIALNNWFRLKRKVILLCIGMFFSIITDAQSLNEFLEDLFSQCEVTDSTFTLIENDTFSIKYPSFWAVDNEIGHGLDISSHLYNDSNSRTVLLTVVPLSQFRPFVRPNPMVRFYRHIEGELFGLPASFSTRNDLLTRGDTVLWRNELKIMDEENDIFYLMVFGKIGTKEQEPSWCDFQTIIKSLKVYPIKENNDGG